MTTSRINRKLIIVFIAVIVCLMVVTLILRVNYKRGVDIYKLSSTLPIHGLILKKPRVIKDFELTTGTGSSFTKDNLRGHWTLMFFGFTHCRYVCPTTLTSLENMLKQLKKKLPTRLLPRVVMVSVDPARDTALVMDKYVKSFNPNFVGVRANLKQLTQFAKQLDISYFKAGSSNDENYAINHSSEIMLIDPNGDLRAFFSFPHKADLLARDYELMMRSIKLQD